LGIWAVVRLVLILGYGCLTLSIGPLSTWLLLNAQTWVGVGIAVIGFTLIALPATCFLWYQRQSHRGFGGWSTMTLGIVLVGILSGILLDTPTGDPQPDSPVRHRFTKAVSFQSYTLTNIIPEAEQVNLGFLIMPYLDPVLTRNQAHRVSALTLELYREMEKDRDFRQLGSVMGWAYAELLGQTFDVGHYYLYIPRNRGDAPFPAIIFLHGSVGNFKAYIWIWSKLAEEQGVVVLAPSFGFGNWQQPGSIATILSALEDAASVIEIDRNQVFLAGLSNGGLGVSRLAATSPEQFRGLILISPVMDTRIIDGMAFQTAWENRPVLIVSGERDRRVPLGYIKQMVSSLDKADVRVTEIVYPGEDHFLFFSQPQNVLDDVSGWLSTVQD